MHRNIILLLRWPKWLLPRSHPLSDGLHLGAATSGRMDLVSSRLALCMHRGKIRCELLDGSLGRTGIPPVRLFVLVVVMVGSPRRAAALTSSTLFTSPSGGIATTTPASPTAIGRGVARTLTVLASPTSAATLSTSRRLATGTSSGGGRWRGSRIVGGHGDAGATQDYW